MKLTSTDQFGQHALLETSPAAHMTVGHAVRAHWRIHTFLSFTVYIPTVEINTGPLCMYGSNKEVSEAGKWRLDAMAIFTCTYLLELIRLSS